MMIIHTTHCRPFDVKLNVISDIIADSVWSIEYIFQNGEAKLTIESPKFPLGEDWDMLAEDEVIPYCLHITGIESMKLSTESGHPELFISGIEKTSDGLRIIGANGDLVFSGHNLALRFLMHTRYFNAGKAIRAIDNESN